MAPSTTTAPPAEDATPASSVSVVEAGLTGTPNYFGRLHVERNQLLRDQLAYGQPGSTEWGEWEEIRRANPFVAAGLDFVLGPIRDARLDVKLAETHPNAALAQQQADFVRWNFAERLEPGLPTFLSQAAGGMLSSGFSLFEPVFAQVQHEALPGGAGYAVRKCAERLPVSLDSAPWVETEDGSTLAAVKQRGPKGGRWEAVTLPADKVLLFSWQRTGNNWAGFSAWRAVWYIAGKVMPELLRLVGVTYQREGAGVPVVSATDAAAVLTPEQRNQLAELLANLVYHENANIILPPGWKLDWVFSGGANKGHVLEAWRQLGIVVLQQVGAQQLALGTSDTGSRSVGETHDARSMAYVKSVVAVVESVLNGAGEPFTGLVRRIVDANWGPQPAYPQVALTLKRPQLEPSARVAAIKSGVDAGLITVTAEDENALREELGLPPIDEEVREAELQRRRAMVPTSAQVDEGDDEESDEEAPEGASPPMKASARRVPGEAWQPKRPLRASEKKLRLADMDAFLTSQRDAFEEIVRPAVVEALVKAQPALTQAMADGSPDEVATLPLDLARLEAAVGEWLQRAREAGHREVAFEVKRDKGEDIAEKRRAEDAPPLKAAEVEQEEEPLPTAEDDADEVLAAQQKALIRRMTNRLRGELESEAIEVLRTGGDASEVVTRTVTRQLETGAFKADAGSVLTRAFNVGRDEAARLMGGVVAVERSAVLDGKQCIPCNSKDGQRANFGTPEHDALVPPERDCAGGGNCRCLLVYLTEDES